MRDRTPTKVLGNGALRYGVYDADGTFLRYEYLGLDDQPTQEGTPLNKASLLKDSTAALLGLGTDAVPDDAFVALVLGQGVYGYRVKVQLADGTPVKGSTVTGIEPLTGSTLVTGEDGVVLGKSTSASVTISCISPYIDQKAPASQSIASTGTITDVTLTLANNTDVLTIMSSQTINTKFSKLCTTFDICAVGGGENGSDLSAGGCGAAGGYSNGIDPISVTSMDFVIGAAVPSLNNSNPTENHVSSSIIKINGAEHQFQQSFDYQIGAYVDVQSEGVRDGTPGTPGFHIFGDETLPIVGSSGGSGASVVKNDGKTHRANGGVAGAGAGNGGTSYVSRSNGAAVYNTSSGGAASEYGCGGGGSGVAGYPQQPIYKYSSGGIGKQGACFVRFHFAA